jgi:hypothetical protein
MGLVGHSGDCGGDGGLACGNGGVGTVIVVAASAQ